MIHSLLEITHIFYSLTRILQNLLLLNRWSKMFTSNLFRNFVHKDNEIKMFFMLIDRKSSSNKNSILNNSDIQKEIKIYIRFIKFSSNFIWWLVKFLYYYCPACSAVNVSNFLVLFDNEILDTDMDSMEANSVYIFGNWRLHFLKLTVMSLDRRSEIFRFFFVFVA